MKIFTPLILSLFVVSAAWTPASGEPPLRKVRATTASLPEKEQKSQTDKPLKIIGCIVGPSEVYPVPGMYEISSDGSMTLLADNIDAIGGGVFKDGKYYFTSIDEGSYFTTYTNYIFDATTWNYETYLMDASASTAATDMSVDPETGTIYGCFYPDWGSSYSFSKLNVNTYWWSSTTVKSGLTDKWNGVAFDTDGTLYVLTIKGELYTVDKKDGAMTLVGDTGVEPYYSTSAAIDPKTRRLYWSVCNSEGGYLYEIDKSTAEATLICTFPNGEQVCGVYPNAGGRGRSSGSSGECGFVVRGRFS